MDINIVSIFYKYTYMYTYINIQYLFIEIYMRLANTLEIIIIFEINICHITTSQIAHVWQTITLAA